jgi:putative ABC transport system substrate-binding protein
VPRQGAVAYRLKAYASRKFLKRENMDSIVNRRQFVLFVSLLLAAGPARAQKSERLRRVAVLMGGSEDPQGVMAFTALREGLRQLGWIEGRNLEIKYHWGEGQATLMRAHAEDLVKWKPDIIVVRSATALREVRRVAGAVPIVFVSVSDPVGNGFVPSLARPGGNITGFSNLEYEMAGKWLQLLKEIAPQVTRVLTLQGAGNPNWPGWQRAMETYVSAFNLQLMRPTITDGAQIEPLIAAFASEPNGGLIVLPDPFLQPHRALIFSLAAKHRVPAIYGGAGYDSGEGLIFYGVDTVDVSRRAAIYVNRILNGEKAGELPVQTPTKFELVVNKKAAKALGLAVPASLLVRADRVVE